MGEKIYPALYSKLKPSFPFCKNMYEFLMALDWLWSVEYNTMEVTSWYFETRMATSSNHLLQSWATM